MKFKIGDIANGIQTSEQIIEEKDYISALENILKRCNVYCEPADKEAEGCVSLLLEFCEEQANNIGTWIEQGD